MPPGNTCVLSHLMLPGCLLWVELLLNMLLLGDPFMSFKKLSKHSQVPTISRQTTTSRVRDLLEQSRKSYERNFHRNLFLWVRVQSYSSCPLKKYICFSLGMLVKLRYAQKATHSVPSLGYPSGLRPTLPLLTNQPSLGSCRKTQCILCDSLTLPSSCS